MRKPNFVQIKLDTGRVQKSFYIDYERLETNIDALHRAADKIFTDITFNHETCTMLLDYVKELDSIVQRVKYLQSL